MQADIEAHYHWIDNVVAGALVPACAVLSLPSESAKPQAAGRLLKYAPAKTVTQQVDAILVHKVWGLVIFAAVMALLFVSIFWLASPVMDGIKNGVAWLGTFDIFTSFSLGSRSQHSTGCQPNNRRG